MCSRAKSGCDDDSAFAGEAPRSTVRNLFAIAVGIVAMVAALVVASGTTSQDTAPRPQAALVMATSFHVTPSATPTDTATPGPTFTPSLTPTPLHLTDIHPSSEQILSLLFQYPEQGSMVTPGPDNSVEQVPLVGTGQDILVVMGEGGQSYYHGRRVPVAYGAILLWVNDEYSIAFEHAEFGHRDARVIYSVDPDNGQIRFMFQDIGVDSNSSRELRRFFTVSCTPVQCKVISSTAGYAT